MPCRRLTQAPPGRIPTCATALLSQHLQIARKGRRPANRDTGTRSKTVISEWCAARTLTSRNKTDPWMILGCWILQAWQRTMQACGRLAHDFYSGRASFVLIQGWHRLEASSLNHPSMPGLHSAHGDVMLHRGDLEARHHQLTGRGLPVIGSLVVLCLRSDPL